MLEKFKYAIIKRDLDLLKEVVSKVDVNAALFAPDPKLHKPYVSGKNSKINALQHICFELFAQNARCVEGEERELYKAIIVTLAENGADLTVRHQTMCFSNTLLIEAVTFESNNKWAAPVLIDSALKSDNEKNKQLLYLDDMSERHNFPLIFAFKTGCEQKLITKMLENTPVEALDKRDGFGLTFLHLAYRAKRLDLVDAAIKKGASSKLRCYKGFYPADYYEMEETTFPKFVLPVLKKTGDRCKVKRYKIMHSLDIAGCEYKKLEEERKQNNDSARPDWKEKPRTKELKENLNFEYRILCQNIYKYAQKLDLSYKRLKVCTAKLFLAPYLLEADPSVYKEIQHLFEDNINKRLEDKTNQLDCKELYCILEKGIEELNEKGLDIYVFMSHLKNGSGLGTYEYLKLLTREELSGLRDKIFNKFPQKKVIFARLISEVLQKEIKDFESAFAAICKEADVKVCDTSNGSCSVEEGEEVKIIGNNTPSDEQEEAVKKLYKLGTSPASFLNRNSKKPSSSSKDTVNLGGQNVNTPRHDI